MKISFILTGFLFVLTSFKTDSSLLNITWVENLPGNFYFAKKHSITCEAWCYEWAGTNSIVAIQESKDTVHCYTEVNTATHCSLDLIITNNACSPTIVLRSIVPNRDKVYPYESGYLKIDTTLWKKHILKAEFDLHFKNDENEKKVFWKGKVFTKIK